MTTFLEQEIGSQPDVIARLLEHETARVQDIVAQLPAFDYALIAARGTSDHAALYAKYAWPALSGYPVALATPSLHTLYGVPPRMRGALVVGVSQSGQSPDIVAVLEEGKRQGRPTLAITNDGVSPLAAVADHVIELHAGPEYSVAATKTYTAQLMVMALLAAAWSGQSERQAELALVPEAMRKTFAGVRDTAAQIAERYHAVEQCIVVGRGYNYATAFELALKLKELTYAHAHAYSAADIRHGPIATVSKGLLAILLMPGGAVFADMLELAQDMKQRGADLLIISDSAETDVLANSLLPIVPLPEWLSPLAAILPGQLLALQLTLAKGLDPDKPRGLQKVTLTR